MARRSRIKGRSQLRKRLSRMPQSIKGEIQDAVLIAANMVYDEAQRNVPVDEGDLKKAMKIRHRGDKLGATIGYYKKGNLKNWRSAGWRAHFAEFGTQDFKARPFLGPAFLKTKNRIKRIISRAVDKGLRKASRGSFS